MTTDITELAQRTDLLMDNALETAKQLRELSESSVAEAIFESIVENENGKEIQFERPISDLAYAAFLQLERLVEALEKEQAGEKQWREVVDAFCADDADWHKLTNSNNELIALLSQALCKQAERIAELESRTVTVKLASRRLPSDYVDGEFGNDDLAAIHNACRLECKVSVEKYLSAHGIVVKWEDE